MLIFWVLVVLILNAESLAGEAHQSRSRGPVEDFNRPEAVLPPRDENDSPFEEPYRRPN